MAQVGDILRYTFKGTYLGQEIINVFFWRIKETDDNNVSLFATCDEISAQFRSQVLNLLSEKLNYTSIEVDNLTDGLEYAEYGMDISGTSLADAMPSYVCLGVKLNRLSKVTRNGSKRFCGVTENKATDNIHLYAPAEVSGVQSFCGAVRVLADYDGTTHFVQLEPVIVGRTKNASGVYELDLSRVNTVVSASVKTNLTTQNTRKA